MYVYVASNLFFYDFSWMGKSIDYLINEDDISFSYRFWNSGTHMRRNAYNLFNF